MKLIAILLLSGLAACTKAASSASPDALGDTAAARAAVSKLEAEVIATARTDGCASVAGCRTAPIGDKACGGPRSYIAYCAASTDSAALFTKVNELKEADRKLNKLTHAVSTCEFRMPPTPTLAGGRCTAP